MQELKKRFGRLVAVHRKHRGITQDALAEAIGMSVDMISRIEAGATGASFATIDKLATALRVDPAHFFTSELPGEAFDRAVLVDLTVRLGKLSDKDLRWIGSLIDVALKGR